MLTTSNQVGSECEEMSSETSSEVFQVYAENTKRSGLCSCRRTNYGKLQYLYDR
jgi:hypothetical protein